MHQNKFYIARLIANYLAEDIDSHELAELIAWRKESETNEALFQRVVSHGNMAMFYQEYSQVDTTKAWSRFQVIRQQKSQRTRWKRAMMYAAILLIPIAVGVVAIMHQSSPTPSNELYAASDIIPGESRAILKLTTGDIRNLTDKDTLQLDQDQSLLAVAESAPQVETKMNEIETPRGGEYQMTLSDGTKVYLNAMSSLSFPSEFSDDERRVTLKGEAYFEVTKSSKPFIVTTDRADVLVLGTSFNISAYDSEPYQAALVKGSIAVSTAHERQLLKPSHSATIEDSGSPIVIEETDAWSIAAWHAGKIIFKDQSLEHIMKRLSRWYDFDVKFSEESIKQLQFSCAVDKYESILDFIRLLESTKKVNAEIKDQTIYLK